MEVKVNKGTIVLKKPTAGARNDALVKAETPDGIKNTILMVELLPHCIASHPFGMTPVGQALRSLSIEEYDKLINGLGELMTPVLGDVGKKSEKPSEIKDSQKDGSEKS